MSNQWDKLALRSSVLNVKRLQKEIKAKEIKQMCSGANERHMSVNRKLM